MNIPLVHSLIWCWMLVMLAASPSHAFYHLDEQSGGPIFQKERCYGDWDKGERAFALYDNLNCPLDKLSQGSVICPRSDEFVPADVFMCNIPLQIAIRQPMSVENSLDAIVYGNLKIKKLIEEQEAQKEKAREVLAGLRVPFVDFRMSFLERTRTQQGVEAHRRSSDLSDTASLHSSGNRIRSVERGQLYLNSRRSARERLYLPIRPIYQQRSESSVQDQSFLPGDTENSQAEPPRRTK